MAEKSPQHHEHEKSHESTHDKHEQHEKLKDSIEAGKNAKNEVEDSLETIRSSIDKEADSGKHKKQEQEADAQKDQGPGHVIIDRDVKTKAYKKELHRIQSHLTRSQKSFSKFIHNPVVESVSEVSGKTVARPSGLLGGGIVALLGSGALVIISRHYGFTYNFFVFIALLIAGFFLGLVVEMFVRGIVKAKS